MIENTFLQGTGRRTVFTTQNNAKSAKIGGFSPKSPALQWILGARQNQRDSDNLLNFAQNNLRERCRRGVLFLNCLSFLESLIR